MTRTNNGKGKFLSK